MCFFTNLCWRIKLGERHSGYWGYFLNGGISGCTLGVSYCKDRVKTCILPICYVWETRPVLLGRSYLIFHKYLKKNWWFLSSNPCNWKNLTFNIQFLFYTHVGTFFLKLIPRNFVILAIGFCFTYTCDFFIIPRIFLLYLFLLILNFIGIINGGITKNFRVY